VTRPALTPGAGRLRRTAGVDPPPFRPSPGPFLWQISSEMFTTGNWGQ